MSNFEKYEHWLDLCIDDLDTVKWLLDGKRLLYCGYFCHLITEKALKAAVAKNTGEIPPKIHDLRKLAKLSGVFDKLSKADILFINDISSFQIEARYPEYKEKINQTLSEEYCTKLIQRTEDFLCWIKKQLEN